MNPRIKLLSMVIGISMLCTACGTATTSKGTQDSTSDTHKTSMRTTASADASTAAAPAGDSAATDAKPFCGNWKVTSIIGTSTAYALSEDEIKSLIGTTVAYGSGVSKNGSSEIDISGYKEKTESSDDFYKNFRIQLTDIGIAEDTVKAVTVCAEGDFFGAYFYIKDRDTLVIYYDGVFFEAIRSD